jgi:hypothetical protein
LLSSFRDVCWSAHDDSIVVSKVDHPERCNRFDLGITANEKLALGDRQITDDTIALVVEHSFEKGDPVGWPAQFLEISVSVGDSLPPILAPTTCFNEVAAVMLRRTSRTA